MHFYTSVLQNCSTAVSISNMMKPASNLAKLFDHLDLVFFWLLSLNSLGWAGIGRGLILLLGAPLSLYSLGLGRRGFLAFLVPLHSSKFFSSGLRSPQHRTIGKQKAVANWVWSHGSICFMTILVPSGSHVFFCPRGWNRSSLLITRVLFWYLFLSVTHVYCHDAFTKSMQHLKGPLGTHLSRYSICSYILRVRCDYICYSLIQDSCAAALNCASWASKSWKQLKWSLWCPFLLLLLQAM